MIDRYPQIALKKLTPVEWAVLSEKAHQVVFDKKRPASMERIDYALLATENDLLVGYLTARELDADSVYWQFGGAFPDTAALKVFFAYQQFLNWTKEQGYKRITTLVENENLRYLKLAMKFGFRIIGCRFFEGEVLVELLNDFSKGIEGDGA